MRAIARRVLFAAALTARRRKSAMGAIARCVILTPAMAAFRGKELVRTITRRMLFTTAVAAFGGEQSHNLGLLSGYLVGESEAIAAPTASMHLQQNKTKWTGNFIPVM